jgi:hypothetical protein
VKGLENKYIDLLLISTMISKLKAIFRILLSHLEEISTVPVLTKLVTCCKFTVSQRILQEFWRFFTV